MPFLHSVQGKLTALLVSVSVLITLIVGGFFIYSTVRDNDAAEMAYRKNLEEQYDQILKLQTEGLITALNAIYKRQMSGELTEEQAKDLAADLIRSDRYDDGKGYFFADEKDTGICVVHAGQPAAEGTMRQEAKDTNGFYYMKEIFKVAQAPGGGYCNFNYPKPGETESLPKRGYSVEFKPYQWIVGTGSWIDYIDDAAAAHIAENREALYQKILMSVIIMVAVTIIMTVAGARLAKRFADPISFVTRRLQKFAEGDYRQEPVNPAFAAAQDETGQMIQGISALGVNMRKLLNAMGTSAEQVAGNASQLNEMTEQSSAASNQIAESITDVAGSTNKQLAAVDEASQSMTRLSERISLVFDHAKKAATETVQATETARNGNAVVERTVADMERLNEVVGESAKTVNDLGERSEAIGKITETISGIAEQTNLLALNAAIEAARAGEQGRGFAVVADEIRKLAAQSDEATKQISTLITQIQQETAHAVNSMEQGTEQLSTTRSSVEEAGHEFQSIVQLVETIAKRSKEIEDASREVSGNAENCQKAIHAIEEMSRNVVSNSETVSAATEEQAASIHEMAISSQQLSEMATSLQKEVAHFKV